MIGYLLNHPSCLLGPKIWLSRHPGAVFHRQLVMQAWPNRSRWQWCLLLLANWLYWYFFLGWRSLFRALKKAPQDRNNWDLSGYQLFVRLAYLVFWIGAPANDFYAFGLNRVDRYAWLDYVYSSEELSWQRVFSCPADAPSAETLNDKFRFEQALNAAEVLTTDTRIIVEKDCADTDIQTLFDDLPLFIKPRRANAMRGCMQLLGDPDNPRLQGYNLERLLVNETNPQEIIKHISSMAASQPLLIQTMLANAKAMSEYAGTEELVTLRLITGCQDNHIVLAYSILEVPVKEGSGWDLQALAPGGESVLLGPVPDFASALDTVVRLHQEMRDIVTVAWDLCLTEKGWTVLEGNTGWALISPQSVSGIPLLRSGLQDCYCLFPD